MIVCKVTSKGLGICVMGEAEELEQLYLGMHEVIEFDDEENGILPQQTDLALSICYEIRKCFQGARESKRKSRSGVPYIGVAVENGKYSTLRRK